MDDKRRWPPFGGLVPLILLLGARFAGSEACRDCHEDLADAFRRSPIGYALQVPRTAWESKGCEACHGPSWAHAEDPEQPTFNFPAQAIRRIAQTCLACHRENPRVNAWDRSPHAAEIACTDCHEIHTEKGDTLKKPDPELCLSCHPSVRLSMRAPYRHPVREKKVQCSDCHNPHDRDNWDAQTNFQQACERCHTEKRGLLRFPHRPVLQNCVTCHRGHGSPYPGLLKSRQPGLCLDCHDALPATHEIVSPEYRQCTSCHRDIHGSAVDPRFLR